MHRPSNSIFPSSAGNIDRVYRNIINVAQGTTEVSQVIWTVGGGVPLLTAGDITLLNQFGFHQLVYCVFTLFGSFDLPLGAIQDNGTLSISSQDGDGVMTTQNLQVARVANLKIASAAAVNRGRQLSVTFRPRQTQEATLLPLATFLALNFGRLVLTTSEGTAAATREYRVGIAMRIVSKMDL